MTFFSKALRVIHRRFFLGRRWYKMNLLLHELSLHGLGVLNYENDTVSGEDNALRRVLQYNAEDAGTDQPYVVLDIGANVGDFSRKAKLVAPSARVFAFEPHPVTFAHTEAAARSANFTAVNAGCGEAVGVLILYDYEESAIESGSQHASLYRSVIEGLHGGRAAAYEVAITTIDQFVDEHKIDRVRMLKIDTEGHEASVLRGARNTIASRRIDFVQFEFNEMNVESRTFFKDFVDLLPGYQLHRMLPDGLAPLSYDPVRCEIFAFQNILAIRADLSLGNRTE